MKKEDIINVSMNAREALRVYVLLCKANGAGNLDLYRKLKGIFDCDSALYLKHIARSPWLRDINYHGMQQELETEVFNNKTESELQLEQVMSKLSELQNEAQRLQEIVAKENK